jgi:RNA polymerase sigma factor (sigma-70 family)
MGLLFKWSIWAAESYGGEARDYHGTAWLTLHAACKTYNPKLGKPSTHISHALKWKLREQANRDRGYRKRTNSWVKLEKEPIYEDSLVTNRTSVLDQVVKNEERNRDELLISSLNPDHRQAVRDYINRIPLRESAKQAGVVPEAIRQRRTLGLKKLKILYDSSLTTPVQLQAIRTPANSQRAKRKRGDVAAA